MRDPNQRQITGMGQAVAAHRQVRQGGRGLMVVGVLTSVLLHATIVAGVVLSALFGGREDAVAPPPMLEFESVELLALGEEKPPNQLPRIANPAPPKVEEKAINLAKPEQPKPPEEKPVEPKVDKTPPPDTQSRRNKLLEGLEELNNPNRPSNDEVPEGSAQGVAGGTQSDAALANMMNTYQAHLLQALRKYWRVPSTLSDAEIKALAGTVSVYVRLSESGHVVTFRFVTQSANEQFNDSIARVLRQFEVSTGRQLPMPDDPQVRALVVREGLNMRNWNALAQ